MRLTILPLLVAGAGLASQVGASPLRVVVVSGHTDSHTNNGVAFTATEVHKNTHPPCGRMKSALNKITAFFPGWRTTESYMPPLPPTAFTPDQPESDMAHILPFGKPGPLPIGPLFHVGAVSFEQLEQLEEAKKAQAEVEATDMKHAEEDVRQDDNTPGPLRVIHVGHRPHHFGMGRHRRPFVHRLHFALAALGPWEGRAVAFVLGCGIGVLLRMIWVLAVVVVRAARPHSSSDDTEVEAIFDAEEYAIAPPEYPVDLKVAVSDNEKTEETTQH
ncbi:hypothetical protein CERSUDRAFT_87128 [Gelatoporia subvermispora B]|uniref:Protein BIG1 n=1 Tax=Ceriporiopsis subvermispora (strain B) TaxID=914234 RepID=M2PDD7_CERS8|nr:hypothetical protein CERSUDRAFT_87128 [Gelatoporia subvermispora B]